MIKIKGGEWSSPFAVSMRKRTLKIHRIIGLITGLVVFVVAITGCLWVFKDEIEENYADRAIEERVSESILTVSEAREIAEKAVPGQAIHGVVYHKNITPIEVIFYQADPAFYQSVYLHPYSGKVLHRKDHFSGFFAFVLKGHTTLWLPPVLGSWIVGLSVLFFLVIIVTGMILWWPKTKKARKQRFTFQWKETTKWRRKNYDLHAIIGFYSSALGFVLAFTGCVMAFTWFYFIAYKAAGGSKNPAFEIPVSKEKLISDRRISPIDSLIPKLDKEIGTYETFELHYQHDDSSAIYVEVSHGDAYYTNDYVFYDQNTLEELSVNSIYGKYEDANFGDLFIRMNYDIHIGAIGGLPGKIIAFIISLLIASLPVTGIVMWWGRRKKGKA